MLIVADIYPDIQKIFGTCDEESLLKQITDVVALLANKGDIDPLLGEMDICVDSEKCVTLPAEVEVPLAVNVNGRPGMGRDRWFNFHLNGPGDCGEHCTPCQFYWQDGAETPLFRELAAASKLVAFVDKVEDANAELRVYGYDANNVFIRTQENGVWVDGYRVPTIFGFAMPEAGAPYFSRIVRIKKARTVGPIRLTSLDVSATTGTLIGMYQFDETDPIYRRIKLSKPAKWVRVAYRKRRFKIVNQQQVLPMTSRRAIIEMARAIKAYDNDDIATGQGHEATATRFIMEEQERRTPPVDFPMQYAAGNLIADKCDELN